MVEIILAIVGIYALIATIVCGILIYKDKWHEHHYYEVQSKLLDAQLKEINALYYTMRGWRHDYHNHMQRIKANITMNQLEDAMDYISQMEEDLDSIDLKYRTGNASVDAVLNSKLTLAENDGIKVKCNAIVPDRLMITDVDLCVIIGNLIDNAIEACNAMKPEDDRFVRVYICIMKGQLYITVTNATKEIIRKLDKEYITNKRGNHGHGLHRINNVVEKYSGYINRKNEPGAFVTEIMLPM